MDTQPSTSRLAELARSTSVGAHESVYAVGFMPEGAIPLIETPSDGRSLVCLPGVRLPRAGGPHDAIAAMRASLAAETGCDASEWVVMSRYGIPTGDRGMATILMAPSLRRIRRGEERLPALRHRVHEVPVADANGWLAERRENGADIDPKVWVGLLLAERHFPRWARARLCAALTRLRLERA